MRLHHLLSLLLLLLAPAVQAAVLAIDYGAEFTKLSLVKPGVPFDVVLDKDSKRKISSVVGWKRDDRVFGAEAKMAATRFPDTHFPYVKPLLGSTAQYPLDVHPNPPSLTSDGVLVFPHPSPPTHLSPAPSTDQEVWTPTALLAHQIAYYRHLAETTLPSGSTPEPINQVVVTVPAWWDHYQRKAYRDALELQGLTCLAMIGEGTGVALNYAMTRTFPDFNLDTGLGEKEYHMIYDSGAMSTTATVVAFYQTSYRPTPKSKTLINTTHIDVLGVGYEMVGAVQLDVAVQDLLTKDFVKKSGQANVVRDKRAMAKIAREASRAKQILSANQEANVAIESLFNDVDYRSKISRSSLESAVEDAVPLFSHPISSALLAANLTINDINSVILFGGNTRVPLVQSILQDALGGSGDKIAQNVNTDEAAVLGAAYYGAALSRTFKMKNLNVTERSVWDIKTGQEVVFPQGTRLGERKVFSFPADQDEITMEFAQSTHTSPGESTTQAESGAQSKPILAVQVSGVQAAVSNFTAPSPVVQVTLRLDPRGHLSVANAVLGSYATEVEEKEGGVAGALKGLFGKKDKEVKDPETAEDDVAAAETPADDKKAAKPAKVALKFREKHLGVRPMTGEEKRTTQARLASVAAFEAAKFAREEARNMLEGYIYRLASLLSDDADNRALHEFATADERARLGKLKDETMEWLHEHAESAEETVLRQKRADLETLESPIIFRFAESQTRGKSVEDFQQAMFASRAFLTEARKNNTIALEAAASATPEDPVAPPKYTEDELIEVEELMKDNEVWMDAKMEKQVPLEADLTKDPVVTSKELDERGKRLQTMVLRLIKKKAPRKPKPATSSKSSTSSSASASDAESASASESATTATSSPTDHGPVPPKHTEGDKPDPRVPPHQEL
ncbi:hypothetical protein IAU60_002185 [Kwoniella sp. DSM 27419]